MHRPTVADALVDRVVVALVCVDTGEVSVMP
jgi:hypothetical protein